MVSSHWFMVIHETQYVDQMEDEYKRTGSVSKETFNAVMRSITCTNFQYEVDHQFCQLLQAELEDFMVITQKKHFTEDMGVMIYLDIPCVTWHCIVNRI